MAIASRDFRELRVWEKAHALTLACYRGTVGFPLEEAFGLTSQIRRASSSVAANIAEGCGRGGGDLIRFCRIALGSVMELDYHLLLARDLHMIDAASYEQLQSQAIEVRKMLATYIQRLQATHDSPPKR